jgi:arylsulfatase A-like enzyme
MFATLLTLSLAAPPNVIVILTDDQGWGDLSLHGNTNLRTPHIDSLAKDGARFDRFFVQPVCSPTRAEFLTGRYHPRGGVRDVSTGGERLNLDEHTIADSFQAAGYRTGCFGKWHNGTQYPYHPLGRGFEEYYGFTSGHWGDYFDAPLDHNGKAVTGKGFLADDLTNRVISFATAGGDKPFFCYLAYNTPHSPMQVPDAYWDRLKSADLKMKGSGPQKEDVAFTRAALAMVENLDDNVGRLLKTLAERKLAENTIVVYFHDNGPNSARWNGGMKGRKGSTDEGGVRSPLFVRWPGHVKPGTEIKSIAGAIDLLPTLCDLAGVGRLRDKPLDGVSFANALTSERADLPDRILFQHWNGNVSARSQGYRLDNAGKLFDMIDDPNQTKPVTDRPDVTKRMTDAVAGYRRDVLAGMTKTDDRPLTVGHTALPTTTLPARDGKPVAGVTRSARAPNCSFFTTWTKATDAMTWDVELETAGRYEAIVHYTCPKANVGSVIELSLNGRAVSKSLTEAHDPPLRGAANDRVPRVGESYVKDFKPLSLGRFDLPRGRGVLSLRATAIPGPGVADVRAVELTLVK